MANYLKRPEEVLSLVKQFAGLTEAEILDGFGQPREQTLTPAQQSAMHAQFKQEFSDLDAKSTAYFTARNQRMDEMARALDGILSGDSDPEARWGRALGDLTSDGDRILESTLSGINAPSKKALAFKAYLVEGEAQFVDNLSAKRVASRWGEMSTLHADLMIFMGVLRTRWQSLIDKLREIDAQAAPVVEDLWRPFRYLKDQSADRSNRITEGLRNAERELRRLTEGTPTGVLDQLMATRIATSWMETTGSGLDTVASTIRDTMLRNLTLEAEDWEKALQNFQNRSSMLRSLRESERDGIHRIFRDARQETQNFVNRPSPDRAKTLAEEAKRYLDDWASSLSSNGAKSDAQQFANDLHEQVQKKLRMIEDLYLEFETQNKGRFYSALGDDVSNALLLRDKWRQRYDALKDYRVTELVNEQRTRLRRCYDVDLARAFSDLQAAAAAREVPAELASKKDALVAQIRSAASDIDARLKVSFATFDNVLERVGAFVERAEFAELFLRTELENSIRP